MVVPVLMTNCQVSENLKRGPDTSQIIITKNEMMKAAELPVTLVTAEDIFSKPDLLFFCLIIIKLLYC